MTISNLLSSVPIRQLVKFLRFIFVFLTIFHIFQYFYLSKIDHLISQASLILYTTVRWLSRDLKDLLHLLTIWWVV